MTGVDDLRDVERELERVVARAAGAAPQRRQAAEAIVAQTRLLTDEIPATASIPDLQAPGLGAMIAVLGTDYLSAARATVVPDPAPVLATLIALRRALP